MKCLRYGANSPRQKNKNNKIEDWHYKLKGVARKVHPMRLGIAIFEQEKAHTEVSIAQLATSSQPVPSYQPGHHFVSAISAYTLLF